MAKPGRKPKNKDIGELDVVERMSHAEITKAKRGIIDLLESEICTNLTDAAAYIGLPKLKVYGWTRTDDEFRRKVKDAQEILADRLETKIFTGNNVIGHIFMLKKLRPEYRENFKINIENNKLEDLMSNLIELGKKDSKCPTTNSES